MMTFNRPVTVPGRRTTLLQSLTLAIPFPRLVSCAGIPTVSLLNRFSSACHASAAVALVGGLVTISVAAHSDLSSEIKAGVCIGSGLVMLGSYFCCKMSSTYEVAAFRLESFSQSNHFDDEDLIDDYEEQIAFANQELNSDPQV